MIESSSEMHTSLCAPEIPTDNCIRFLSVIPVS